MLKNIPLHYYLHLHISLLQWYVKYLWLSMLYKRGIKPWIYFIRNWPGKWLIFIISLLINEIVSGCPSSFSLLWDISLTLICWVFLVKCLSKGVTEAITLIYLMLGRGGVGFFYFSSDRMELHSLNFRLYPVYLGMLYLLWYVNCLDLCVLYKRVMKLSIYFSL